MTTTTGMTVANEIARQIGNRAFTLMGTRYKVGDERSLMFDIRGCKEFNKIRVTLDASDTYTVEFLKISGRLCEIKAHRTIEGVYFDMLHEVIEKRTGLYLSL